MAGHRQTPRNLTATIPPAKVLTAIGISKLKPGPVQYEIRDAGARGLRVFVQPSGYKSYHLRFWHRGKGHNMALGSVLEGVANDTSATPVIGTPLTLADARMLAATVLREIKSGRGRGSLKRAAGAPGAGSVEAVVADYLKRESPRLRSARQRAYDLSLVCQSLGTRTITEVRASDIARMRDKVEEENGPGAADRLLTSWSAMAGWYAARSDDFTPPIIRRLRIKQEARERTLTDAELVRVWQAAGATGAPFGPLVQFLLLTACRRSEAAEMVRSELSDGGALWTIPVARTKMKKEVVLPLSRAAQEIIAGLPVIAPGTYVFTTNGSRPIDSFSRYKDRLDTASGVTGWVIHDLRRTARTLLSRAGVSADTAERCLGHAIGGVRGVYDRHRYETEMRDAFERLAAQIEAITG